jgi:hypothetical protein
MDKTSDIVEEAKGDLFEAPDNAVLIREQLSLITHFRWLKFTNRCM